MNPTLNIILDTIVILTAIFVSNCAILELYLDKRTKYKYDLAYDNSKVKTLMLSLSFILIFFKRRLRKYRKDLYYERRLNYLIWHYNLWKTLLTSHVFIEKISKLETMEIKECNRYLKLRRLQKKKSLLKYKMITFPILYKKDVKNIEQ